MVLSEACRCGLLGRRSQNVPIRRRSRPEMCTRRSVESSGRSRGFKFALLSGVAAYLSGTKQVIVPESGQGALGPSLIPVGQEYEDYRNHPLFTHRMTVFLSALLDHKVRYTHPRLWHTKAETLAEFVANCLRLPMARTGCKHGRVGRIQCEFRCPARGASAASAPRVCSGA